jgi:transcriptional regulator with XRE-family HTH domain
MSTRHRRVDRGAQRARQLLRSLGDELRTARIQAGLSQAALGDAVGVRGAHIGRLERAEVAGAAVALYARLFAVLGMRLSARPYPEGVGLRDEGAARLLRRFQKRLHPTIPMRTEVRLKLDGDQRAWDAELGRADATCKLEAETALYDFQAQTRRIMLKKADDGVEVVILLVADTHRNRRVLREFRELIRAEFPLDTREVLRALRAGRLPERSGIVIL